jgi:hypothetical protein
LHIGQLIFFVPLQDLQLIMSPFILFSEALEKSLGLSTMYRVNLRATRQK